MPRIEWTALEESSEWSRWAHKEIEQIPLLEDKVRDLQQQLQRSWEESADRLNRLEVLQGAIRALESHIVLRPFADLLEPGARVFISEPEITGRIESVEIFVGMVRYCVTWWDMDGRKVSVIVGKDDVVPIHESPLKLPREYPTCRS